MGRRGPLIPRVPLDRRWFEAIWFERRWLEKTTRFLRCLLYWDPPKYEPHRWNDNDGIQFNNNCYNYATNIRTDTYAQPGMATGRYYLDYGGENCPNVTLSALSDGLRAVGADTSCVGRCHKVALVMDPGWDYHWYRLDENGMWSHKMGPDPATNLDNSDNLIFDPRNADRGTYTEFCGFFCVCCDTVTVS